MGKRLAARRPAFVTLVAFLVTAAAMTWPSFFVSAQAPEPTVEQLKEAVLAPADLGPGFDVVDRSDGGDPPEVFRFLLRLEPEAEQVYVGLGLNVPLSPEAIADIAIESLPSESNLRDVTFSERLAAEWLVPGAIAFQFSGVSGAVAVLGNFYVWRQGPVLALLVVITTNRSGGKAVTTAAPGYAELQRDKLSAVCGPCAP